MNKYDLKKLHRRSSLMNVLKLQGTGVVNITNKALAALLGCSTKSIERDLDYLDGKDIIIRETVLITKDGNTRKQRDIVLPNEPQRRFTVNQHRQLKDINNHFIFTNRFTGEVIWKRRINGEWERNMADKEFASEKQAYSYLYKALSMHHKKAIEGDKYTNRK